MLITALLWLAALRPCQPVTLQTAAARIEWRTPMQARDIHRSGNVLVIENLWGVSAVNARDGRVLWSYHSQNDSRPLAEHVVLSDRVAVVDNDQIIFFDLSSGKELHRTRLKPFVRKLVGPPLVAMTDNGRLLGSTLTALRADGSIGGRRTVRHVHELTMYGDVALAEVDRNPSEQWPALYKLFGFDAVTLEPLWQVHSDFLEVQEIGGRPHIIRTPWGENPRPIDIHTGRMGPGIPTREGRDEIWAAATWEFETPISTPGPRNEYALCDRARRNDPETGRPKWEIDLPFSVGAMLRDGDTFYMFGSTDAEHHFLVSVDWSSGRILGSWSGVPDLISMIKFEDRLIGGSVDELFSLQLVPDVKKRAPAGKPALRKK